MLKKVFLIISLLLMAYLGFEFRGTYMDTHTYYAQMLASSTNWTIVISGILFSLLPTLYVVYAKKISLKTLLALFFVGLALFGFVFTSTKGGVGGWIQLIINSGILFGLAACMFVGLTSIGDLAKRGILKLKTETIFDVLLSLGVGLSLLLLLNYILINLNLFYPIASWLQVIGSICLIRYNADTLSILPTIITQSIKPRGLSSWQKRGLLCMFCLTCLYLYLGFYLADIAYSTAWDANHAYMFYPKMWALNNGYYRNEIGMSTGFQLRYSFIAFWFSLFMPTSGIGGIAVDTIGISLNFWSGLFVIIFGLGLLSEVLLLLEDQHPGSDTSEKKYWMLLMGWLLILLWLTSGMGAFLVFVDNKTDLGVMTLIILALYSGFIAMRSIQSTQYISHSKRKPTLKSKHITSSQVLADKDIWKWGLSRRQGMLLLLSGFFFAVAGMAKVTALFDVVNFFIFTFWIWIGPIGAIAIFLAIVGLMSLIKFRGIAGYISPDVGKVLLAGGAIGGLVDVLRSYMSASRKYLGYLLLWGISFIGVYLLFKVPFHAARTIIYQQEMTPSLFIERVLFSSSMGPNNTSAKGLAPSDLMPMYAQLGVGAPTCTLASQGFTDPEQLYENLLSSPGNTYNEDVGRYVGFGWKGNPNDQQKNLLPFMDPWRGFLFSEGCKSVNPFSRKGKQAKILCENESAWRSKDIATIAQVQALTEQAGNGLSGEVSLLTESGTLASGAQYDRVIQSLDALMQGDAIKVVNNSLGQKEIYIPYKYLTFFNISFNRSLQNLSSYYTDIGIVRLLIIFFCVLGLIYALIARNSVLAALQGVTLFGWILWFFIGGGILWYAVGVIVWSILAFVAFVYEIISLDTKDKKMLSRGFLGVIMLVFLAQLTSNFVRIASQGGSGAFMRYKSNTGIDTQLSETLQQERVTNTSFGQADVFNLQFPHYNKFIQAMNQSTSDEGAMIAGTYARYFVEDQTNINYDQFLTRTWEMTSDGDMCNTYLRLKDSKKKYIVIDPNIGTVVQGSGNSSLFDRFFAKIDKTTGAVLEDGVMTSLANMVEAGYLQYFSSNNLGSKYAYMLPNTSFGNISDEKRILERARLSVPRFRGSQIVPNILQIADQRINDGSFIEDIADMYGKQIRVQELRNIISGGQIDPTMIGLLTQDERYVLAQYLSIRSTKQSDPEKYQTDLETIIKRNIQSGSQLIVLEIK